MPQHRARRKCGGVVLRVGRQVGMSGIDHDDRRDLAPGGFDGIALAGERQTHDVEPRADVPHRSWREGPHSSCRSGHRRASDSTSLSTPAAVTAGPAPGPVITRGLVR